MPKLTHPVRGKGVELEERFGLRDQRIHAGLALERLDRQMNDPLTVVVALRLDRSAHDKPRRAEDDQSGDRRDLREGDETELRFEQMKQELVKHVPTFPAYERTPETAR